MFSNKTSDYCLFCDVDSILHINLERQLIQYQCVNVGLTSKCNIGSILTVDMRSVLLYQNWFNLHFQSKQNLESILMINIESMLNQHIIAHGLP